MTRVETHPKLWEVIFTKLLINQLQSDVLVCKKFKEIAERSCRLMKKLVLVLGPLNHNDKLLLKIYRRSKVLSLMEF
jgi:hypothetical protein